MLAMYIMELLLQGYTIKIDTGSFPGDNPKDKPVQNLYVHLARKGFAKRAQFQIDKKNLFTNENIITALEQLKKSLP